MNDLSKIEGALSKKRRTIGLLFFVSGLLLGWLMLCIFVYHLLRTYGSSLRLARDGRIGARVNLSIERAQGEKQASTRHVVTDKERRWLYNEGKGRTPGTTSIVTWWHE